MIVHLRDEAPAATNDQNPSIAMCEIFKLLNEAMHDGAQVQGVAANDVSDAMGQTSAMLTQLKDMMASLAGDIKAKNDQIDTVRNWLFGFAAVSVAFGLIAPALMGALATAATLTSSAAGIAGGAAQISEGVFQMQLAEATGKMAQTNATVSGGTAAQQNYQASGKWMTNRLSESFSRMGDIAKSLSLGVREINEGIRMAGSDALRGTLHSR